MTADTCTINGNPIYQSCDCNLPMWLCVMANISGYISTVAWFLVLLPQVIRNFHHRSVQRISLGWAILNFTAAFNNAFFVFKLGGLPWYTYGSAVYMPILEILLLIQFYLFAPHSRHKLIAAIILIPFWVTLAAVQSIFNVYKQLEWLSIVMWSAETFPQIFLNMRRHSTYGLANLMVTITAIGKTTDFMQNYLLIMPIQYVIMAYFSSTVAQIQTIQVLWYWKKLPIHEKCEDAPPLQRISTQCNVLRTIGIMAFSTELIIFGAALIIRTHYWWLLAAPVATYAIIFAFYVYNHHWCPPVPIKIAVEKNENQEIVVDC